MTELGYRIFGLIVLLLLYAFLNIAESAVTTLQDKKLERLAENSRDAAHLVKLLSRPGRFTSTVKADSVALCIAAGAIAFAAFPGPLETWLAGLGVPGWLAATGARVLVGFALTFMLLLFGYTVPRYIAGRHSESVALRVTGLLRLLIGLTGWFSALVRACGRGLCRLVRVDPATDDERVTEEEIRMLVDVGEEKGVIQESEKFMIDNVFEFGDKTVGDIMTHRMDIAAIDAEATLEEILDFVSSEKYSRFPIYNETLDDIIGTLHVKDLMPYVRGTAGEPFDIHKVLLPPFIAPESKKADELFRDLKRSKKYIAIVIDEYGGTAGICTMEDLMESIVGSIFDEYDQEEGEPIERIGEDWLFDGGVSLEEVGDTLGVEFYEEDCDTLGGFIFARLGRIPEEGERPVVTYGGYSFAVVELVGRRVAKVHVAKLPEPEDAADEAE